VIRECSGGETGGQDRVQESLDVAITDSTGAAGTSIAQKRDWSEVAPSPIELTAETEIS